MPGRPLLNPETLGRLRRLVFASRHPVEGRWAGAHASPRLGRGGEFVDHRAYEPGDAPGDVDWKIYARSDRLMVRRFSRETELTARVLVDASASMGYAGHGRDSKLRHASELAATLAGWFVDRRDRVALATVQDELSMPWPPRHDAAALAAMLKWLEALRPKGKAPLAKVISQLSVGAGRREVLFLISDLLDEPAAEVLQALSRFAHRGTEIVVFHVLDPDELILPDRALMRYEDMESDQKLDADGALLRRRYQDEADRFVRTWSAQCRAQRITHHLVRTDTPVIETLGAFFTGRTGGTRR